MAVQTYSLAANGNLPLSESFRVRDFASPDGCDQVLIDNGLVTLMQCICNRFGGPVDILSAYRTCCFNESIGGSPKSQHLFGRAADIQVRHARAEDVAAYAETLCPGGLGVQEGRQCGTFVHIDTRQKRTRWYLGENFALLPVAGYYCADHFTQAAVQSTQLNLRSGPGTQHDVITVLERGETMAVLQTGDEWFKVCRRRHTGYVNANYIRILAVYSRQLYYSDTELLRGDDVLFVQVQLFQRNYEPGPLNGVYTEQTQKAVRSFQYRSNLDVDGVVGLDTWRRLQGECFDLQA
ncbi:MAG: D-Ala-D-Ala carboxypeptidase family metallohydrolase [Christensenellales bacterium]|jgi:uncharacterized protein YraI